MTCWLDKESSCCGHVPEAFRSPGKQWRTVKDSGGKGDSHRCHVRAGLSTSSAVPWPWAELPRAAQELGTAFQCLEVPGESRHPRILAAGETGTVTPDQGGPTVVPGVCLTPCPLPSKVNFLTSDLPTRKARTLHHVCTQRPGQWKKKLLQEGQTHHLLFDHNFCSMGNSSRVS